MYRGDSRDPSTITDIANDIVETAIICHAHGVQHIFVGGVTVRRPRWTWKICRELNDALSGQCDLHNFHFIDNNNISTSDLYDGVHLNNNGTHKLAENILGSLNYYFDQNILNKGKGQPKI